MNTDLVPARAARASMLLAALFFIALPASGRDAADRSAGAEAGHIVMGSGRLIARSADGAERRLRRRSRIYAGDTIIVGDNAFIQVRFTDGGLVSLRPGSEFRVSEYRFRQQEPEDGKLVFELVKGGLRTITGSIGKKKHQNYRLKTPVSTIGIRGTHYGARLCAGDCRKASGELMPDGLYGGVVDGAIVSSNQGGKGVFGNDQYFYVADLKAPAAPLLGPPGILFDRFDVAPGGARQGRHGRPAPPAGTPEGEPAAGPGGETDTGDKPPLPLLALNPPPGGEAPPPKPPLRKALLAEPVFTATGNNVDEQGLGLTPAPLGSVAMIAALAPNPDLSVAEAVPHKGFDAPDQVYIATEGTIGKVVSRVVHIGAPDCLPRCELSRGTAALADTGGLAVGLNWGRWVGNWYVLDGAGTHPGVGSWHYIFSDKVTPQADLDALSATATFQYLDGPPPTNRLGQTGVFNSGSATQMVVDFATGDVNSYAVSATVSGATYNGSLATAVNLLVDDRIRRGASFGLDVSCSGTCSSSTGSGHASMTFVGPAAAYTINSVEMHTDDNLQGVAGTFVSQKQ